MEIIKVNVQWCDNNFGASLSDNVPGSVVFTADTFEKLQKEVEETLRFHIEGMVADGENVPQWLMDGNYKFEFSFLDVPTILKVCEPYASLAAISRASGINQHQLSHYANGVKQPRPQQRQRIIDGIHHIAQQLIAVV